MFVRTAIATDLDAHSLTLKIISNTGVEPVTTGS